MAQLAFLLTVAQRVIKLSGQLCHCISSLIQRTGRLCKILLQIAKFRQRIERTFIRRSVKNVALGDLLRVGRKSLMFEIEFEVDSCVANDGRANMWFVLRVEWP